MGIKAHKAIMVFLSYSLLFLLMLPNLQADFVVNNTLLYMNSETTQADVPNTPLCDQSNEMVRHRISPFRNNTAIFAIDLNALLGPDAVVLDAHAKIWNDYVSNSGYHFRCWQTYPEYQNYENCSLCMSYNVAYSVTQCSIDHDGSNKLVDIDLLSEGSYINTVILDANVTSYLSDVYNLSRRWYYIHCMILEDGDGYARTNLHGKGAALQYKPTLNITFLACDPDDICCNDNATIMPAETICEVLNTSCTSPFACLGSASVRQCDGQNASICPAPVYNISYPAACDDYVCGNNASCQDSFGGNYNWYTPADYCSAGVCINESINASSCPDNLGCFNATQCYDECRANSQCGQPDNTYYCNQDTKCYSLLDHSDSCSDVVVYQFDDKDESCTEGSCVQDRCNQAPLINYFSLTTSFPVANNDTFGCQLNATDQAEDSLYLLFGWYNQSVRHYADDENIGLITKNALISTSSVGDIEANDTTPVEEWICYAELNDTVSMFGYNSTSTVIDGPASGDNAIRAIKQGITNSGLSGSVYDVALVTQQQNSSIIAEYVDVLFKLNNTDIAFEYVDTNQSYLNITSLSPNFYIWQNASLNLSEIVSQVEWMINETQ